MHHFNKTKDKNHMKISVSAKKVFNKIQRSFMVKTFNKVGIEGTYFNIIKAIYDRPTANITFNSEKARRPSLTTFFQHRIGSFNQAIRKEKDIKHIQIGEKEALFVDDMILYIDNSKNY